VGDVKNGRINHVTAEKVAINSTDVQKNVGLEVDDILFTRKGTFGNAAVVRQGQEHCIISSEIMLLRLRNTDVLPDYLSLYLNSPIGYQQVERWTHGAAFYSVSQDDLGKVEIALLSKPLQEELARKVQESLAVEQKSQKLLELAKQGVEKAIEEGETVATKWLEGELEALGVKFE
jgi:type I restriction enzyme M protein